MRLPNASLVVSSATSAASPTTYLSLIPSSRYIPILPRSTPNDRIAAFNLTRTTENKLTNGDWSSLIGIITAIIGNVLISVALNTQRYAHIKLNQQYQERRRLVRQARKRNDAAARGVGRSHAGDRPSRTTYGTADTGTVKEQKNGRTKPGPRSGGESLEARSLLREEHETSDHDEIETTEDQPLLSDSMYSEHSDGIEDQRDAVDNEKADVAQKSYLKSPYWWAGIILMTVGEAGNFLAYGFAPASIVSPLGVVALISNCIIAPFFLKERFRGRDFLGVLIAVGGAVTVVLSASDSNPKLGPKQIWELISRWEFETYLGITVALIAVLMWASSKYGNKSIFIDIGLVGLFGGYTALSTKGVASMLSYTVFKALTFPITYLLLAILISTAIMQIKYVNRALQRFDATEVIPTQFVMFTLSVIIGSAVLYRDFEKESSEDAVKFIGGCALTFLGVYFITSGRKKQDEDDEILEEDEEAIRLATEGVYHDEGEQRPHARRSSTAPQHDGLPIKIGKPPSQDKYSISPSTSAMRKSSPALQPPLITRTSTARTTSLVDSDDSQPSSPTGSSPVVQNPWVSPEEQSSTSRTSIQKVLRPLDEMLPPKSGKRLLPPTLKATISEPILPTEANLLERPHTPLVTTTTLDEYFPQTPPLALRGSRPSISDLFPGPLTSTLSSPLSAIVADSLRRGIDPSSLKLKRKRKMLGIPTGNSLQTQRGLSEVDVRLSSARSAEVIPSRSIDSGDGVSEEETQQSEPRRLRFRSFSNPFSDLLRGKSKGKKDGTTSDAATVAETG